MAGHLADIRDVGGMRNAMRESQWWLAYSIALAQTKNDKGDAA